MRRQSTLAIAAAALLGTVSAAHAEDYLFELVSTEDIDIIFNNTNAFYVGNNPSAIAFNGRSLFVGGYNNSGSAQQLRVTEIRDFLLGPSGRSFATVDGSEVITPAFRQYTGLSWDDTQGLLGTVDLGDANSTDQIRLFRKKETVDDLEYRIGTLSGRGSSGIAWDYGADGLGYDYDGDGSADGPVALHLAWSNIPGSSPEGPTGYTLPADPGFGNLGDLVDVLFSDAGAAIAVGGQSTLWRDISVRKSDGTIIARAANNLTVVPRSGTPNNWSTVAEDPSQLFLPQSPTNVFISEMHSDVITGLSTGQDDVIIINDRPDFGTRTFASVVKLFKFDGTQANLVVVDSNGDPVSLRDDIGVYDFSWHEASQTLVISDFTGLPGVRQAYVLRPYVAGGCVADIDGDGIVGFGDVSAFLTAFNNSDSAADVDGDGIIGFGDVSTFITAFNAGC